MKVLVTGGAGFIGSHTVDLLLNKGYDVIVVDNLTTGNRKNVNPDAKLHKIDITSPSLINMFKKEKPDFVIHLAAQANVRVSIENPMYDAKVNIIGSINVLECCRKTRVKKVVYANSGGAVYGEPEYLPVDERHPVKPISPYGISKHTTEHLLFFYDFVYGLKYISLRYANIYGPRQDPKGEAGVVAIFIDNFLNDQNPKINGDGNQTRDFVFVKDIARANLLALEKNASHSMLNIGTGKEISVNQIYKIIKKSLKSDIDAIHGPEIKGEVRRIYLDNSLAKKELGWSPDYGIEKGLKETVEHFLNE